MAKNRWLSSEEKVKIDALHQLELPPGRISDQIYRSRTCVRRYLDKKKTGGQQTKAGRPKKLSPRAVRALVNVARQPRMTASKVLRQRGVAVSLRTAQRRLAESEFTECGHLKSRPKLTPHHVELRYDWAKKCRAMSHDSGDRLSFPMRSALVWTDRTVLPAIGMTNAFFAILFRSVNVVGEG